MSKDYNTGEGGIEFNNKWKRQGNNNKTLMPSIIIVRKKKERWSNNNNTTMLRDEQLYTKRKKRRHSIWLWPKILIVMIGVYTTEPKNRPGYDDKLTPRPG